MICQLALLLLSSLQPGSLHEIDSESTAMSLYFVDWGKESGPLIEGVSSIQGHNIPKTSFRMAQAVLIRELSLFLECSARVDISYTECMECSNIVCACVIINY